MEKLSHTKFIQKLICYLFGHNYETGKHYPFWSNDSITLYKADSFCKRCKKKNDYKIFK